MTELWTELIILKPEGLLVAFITCSERNNSFYLCYNSSTLATSCEDLIHWKRLWCWEGLGAGGEGDDRGCNGWMASLTQWAWVWVNSRSWWWTGRPGVLWFTGSQRVGHDWTTELNWTERHFQWSLSLPSILFLSRNRARILAQCPPTWRRWPWYPNKLQWVYKGKLWANTGSDSTWLGKCGGSPKGQKDFLKGVTSYSYISFIKHVEHCIDIECICTMIAVVQSLSCVQLFVTLMDCRTTGFPVLHYLPEVAQTHIHWVNDAIQPSHLLSSPSPPALNLSQHQGLFQWVSSFYQVPKYLASASTSVLPMNIQDWFPLALTDLISLPSRELSKHHDKVKQTWVCVFKTVLWH